MPTLGREVAQQRRSAADRGEYRQAAGAIAEGIARQAMPRAINQRCELICDGIFRSWRYVLAHPSDLLAFRAFSVGQEMPRQRVPENLSFDRGQGDRSVAKSPRQIARACLAWLGPTNRHRAV